VIWGYRNNGYDAVVFNQRCLFCKALGIFILDKQSYVERIVYRLKRWAGVEMEQPFHARKEGSPHQVDLCEDCKQGYYQKRDGFTF
jgi:hypothetical protein